MSELNWIFRYTAAVGKLLFVGMGTLTSSPHTGIGTKTAVIFSCFTIFVKEVVLGISVWPSLHELRNYCGDCGRDVYVSSKDILRSVKQTHLRGFIVPRVRQTEPKI